jgi:hypothetical protein
MPTTRNELLAAIELAVVTLPALDRASNYREAFVELVALDPKLCGGGRGRRGAYLLGAVVAALRHRDGKPNAAAGRGGAAGQHGASDDEPGANDTHELDDGREEEDVHEVHHVVQHHE